MSEWIVKEKRGASLWSLRSPRLVPAQPADPQPHKAFACQPETRCQLPEGRRGCRQFAGPGHCREVDNGCKPNRLGHHRDNPPPRRPGCVLIIPQLVKPTAVGHRLGRFGPHTADRRWAVSRALERTPIRLATHRTGPPLAHPLPSSLHCHRWGPRSRIRGQPASIHANKARREYRTAPCRPGPSFTGSGATPLRLHRQRVRSPMPHSRAASPVVRSSASFTVAIVSPQILGLFSARAHCPWRCTQYPGRFGKLAEVTFRVKFFRIASA
jgi:hypothetical protein